METKANPWKANFTNGMILGLAGVVFTLILWFLDLTFNRGFSLLFLVISVFLLYYFIKAYRDNYLHGMLTYGQSVGAGMIIWFYSAIIGTIFTYLLFTIIDPELPAKALAIGEEKMRASGKMTEELIDSSLKMQKKFMTPTVMVISSFFGNMLYGLIIVLIVSIFTRKEGNPLIETPAK